MKLYALFLSIFFILSVESQAKPLPRTPAPKGASLYIISPADKAHVKSPVLVQFGLKGMGVAPAGVSNPKTGHHHLLIDIDQIKENLPIPNDKNHKHFGGGQTETLIELKPGKHTLQLILGDHLHIPHKPALKSKRVTIQVIK